MSIGRITHRAIHMGADPEFFFAVKGKTIGAEKVLPKTGLKAEYGGGKVIIDGIQAELNPSSSHCRAYVGNNIRECFKQVYEQLKLHPEVETDFGQIVPITKEEMKSLDPSSKQFGCTPSKNAYTDKNGVKIKNAARYYKRTAGGHIHLGHNKMPAVMRVMETPRRVAQMLDIIAGNTFVLIDRDPGNIERRKNYGKAGEFRLPPHGFEYRTPSNFWLRSYPLAGFALGMARFAINILASSTKKNNFEEEIRSKVDMRKIRKAINTNDFNLAYENFRKIETTILQIVPESTRGDLDEGEYNNYDYPLTPDTIKEFHYFVEKGIDHWFKEDPLEHWRKLPEGHKGGWEDFLMTKVRKEMNANKK